MKLTIDQIKPPLDYHYKRIVQGIQVRGRIEVQRVYRKNGRVWVYGSDKKLGRFITLQPGQIERRVKMR
jgi:hypothetical protein